MGKQRPRYSRRIAGAFQASLVEGRCTSGGGRKGGRWRYRAHSSTATTIHCLVRIVVGEARNGGADGIGRAPRRNAKPRLRSGRCWMRWRRPLVAGEAGAKESNPLGCGQRKSIQALGFSSLAFFFVGWAGLLRAVHGPCTISGVLGEQKNWNSLPHRP